MAFCDPQINRVLDTSSIEEKLSILQDKFHNDFPELRFQGNQHVHPNIKVKTKLICGQTVIV